MRLRLRFEKRCRVGDERTLVLVTCPHIGLLSHQGRME